MQLSGVPCRTAGAGRDCHGQERSAMRPWTRSFLGGGRSWTLIVSRHLWGDACFSSSTGRSILGPVSSKRGVLAAAPATASPLKGLLAVVGMGAVEAEVAVVGRVVPVAAAAAATRAVAAAAPAPAPARGAQRAPTRTLAAARAAAPAAPTRAAPAAPARVPARAPAVAVAAVVVAAAARPLLSRSRPQRPRPRRPRRW